MGSGVRKGKLQTRQIGSWYQTNWPSFENFYIHYLLLWWETLNVFKLQILCSSYPLRSDLYILYFMGVEFELLID